MSRRFGIAATVVGALCLIEIPALYLLPRAGADHLRPALTPWDGIVFGIMTAMFAVIALLCFRSAQRLGWRETPVPKVARRIDFSR